MCCKNLLCKIAEMCRSKPKESRLSWMPLWLVKQTKKKKKKEKKKKRKEEEEEEKGTSYNRQEN